MSVKNIMDTWTLQQGYPILHVFINEDGNWEVFQTKYTLNLETDQGPNFMNCKKLLLSPLFQRYDSV